METQPSATLEHTLGGEYRCVLSGSYRRDHEGLRAAFGALRTAGFVIASPEDLDFVDDMDGFVRAEHERSLDPKEIEARHLRAITRSDFVWLHAPTGYVGRSGAMEVGYAFALGVPVYSEAEPTDITLREMVTHGLEPTDVRDHLAQEGGKARATGLLSLQRYYLRVAQARGWDNETPAQTLELLRGELDELEDAVTASRRFAASEEAALELADVQLYLVHLANRLHVDLEKAVGVKEHINERRFGTRRDANQDKQLAA